MKHKPPPVAGRVQEEPKKGVTMGYYWNAFVGYPARSIYRWLRHSQ